MGDDETLDALRRVMGSGMQIAHEAFDGGLRFDYEGRTIVASDGQVLTVLTELDRESSQARRMNAFLAGRASVKPPGR